MGRRKSKSRFSGIEPGLSFANTEIIKCDKEKNHWTKITIINEILETMKEESYLFKKLNPKLFGTGSNHHNLNVGEDYSDYDVDVLLTIPEVKLVLYTDTVPGFVRLHMENLQKLQKKDNKLHEATIELLDKNDFLSTKKLKSFIQSVFDLTRLHHFPDRVIELKDRCSYEITNVEHGKTALTLTIKGLNVDFYAEIDFVPCIRLTKSYWPKGTFQSNPFKKISVSFFLIATLDKLKKSSTKSKAVVRVYFFNFRPMDFFLVPKRPPSPHGEHPHWERYWRLSFEKQERIMLKNRYWMKPTIRIIKCMKIHFGHQVSSYALKTLFLWELKNDNKLWKRTFSEFFVHMLKQYLICLEKHEIPYFWNNNNVNLIDTLSYGHIEKCKNDIRKVLNAIEDKPLPQTIIKYLQI